jgi:hypothetical protein
LRQVSESYAAVAALKDLKVATISVTQAPTNSIYIYYSVVNMTKNKLNFGDFISVIDVYEALFPNMLLFDDDWS